MAVSSVFSFLFLEKWPFASHWQNSGNLQASFHFVLSLSLSVQLWFFNFFKPKCYGGNTLAPVPEIRTSLLRHRLWCKRASILHSSVWPPYPNTSSQPVTNITMKTGWGGIFFFNSYCLKLIPPPPTKKKKKKRILGGTDIKHKAKKSRLFFKLPLVFRSWNDLASYLKTAVNRRQGKEDICTSSPENQASPPLGHSTTKPLLPAPLPHHPV